MRFEIKIGDISAHVDNNDVVNLNGEIFTTPQELEDHLRRYNKVAKHVLDFLAEHKSGRE